MTISDWIFYKGGQYNWDTNTQAVILESFFYGYVITQLPGGFFAEKFGAKWLFGGGVLVTAILSLITPLAANWGTGAFITVRVLEGLGEVLKTVGVIISMEFVFVISFDHYNYH